MPSTSRVLPLQHLKSKILSYLSLLLLTLISHFNSTFSKVMGLLQTPRLYQVCTPWLALRTILSYALSNCPLRPLVIHCAHDTNTPSRSRIAIQLLWLLCLVQLRKTSCEDETLHRSHAPVSAGSGKFLSSSMYPWSASSHIPLDGHS